ncbi:hypothetical protein AXA84_0011 [Candidatus Phytoplasma oryzae]|uniref:DUF2963 domain-containing protein n=1 Tax=Candidatus Phytoplasma oryzae TaxID=203274 RepID=A0A139JQV4_9MOLU|nr:hypothetical protein [Candidatus Phytoplasma oryzae]KXT29367.1 hypothetical protein AXA84_0011 [Candidatus Phytoplasma oryzae]
MFLKWNKKNYSIFFCFILLFFSFLVNIFFFYQLFFSVEQNRVNINYSDNKKNEFSSNLLNQDLNINDSKLFPIYEITREDGIIEQYNLFLSKQLVKRIDNLKGIIFEYKKKPDDLLFRKIDKNNHIVTQYNDNGNKIKEIFYNQDESVINYIYEFNPDKDNDLIKCIYYFSEDLQKYFILEKNQDNENDAFFIKTTYFDNGLIDFILEYNDSNFIKKTFYNRKKPQTKKYIIEEIFSSEDNFFHPIKKTFFQLDGQSIKKIKKINKEKKVKTTIFFLKDGVTKKKVIQEFFSPENNHFLIKKIFFEINGKNIRKIKISNPRQNYKK